MLFAPTLNLPSTVLKSVQSLYAVGVFRLDGLETLLVKTIDLLKDGR